jgi:PAS domain S-box-containing protein
MMEDERDLLKALEEQRRYYETLIEVSPIAIITGDPDLIVTSWNPGAERLFGYSKEEAIGRHINDLVARADEIRDEAVEVDRKLFEEPTKLVSRRTRKDGSLVDVAICAAPIVLDGTVLGTYAIYEDVSELVRQRTFFESLVASSPAAVIMTDRDATVTLWSPAAEKLFGYTAAEAIGQNLDDLVANQPEIHEEAVAWSVEMRESEEFHRVGRRTRKDGSLVDVDIVAVPVVLEGETASYYNIYHDVTEIEQARRQLQERVDEQMAELVRSGQLASFLPRQVAEGLLGGQLGADESLERHRITVLSADMVGFTDLSESLEPEELAEVLNTYLREMTAAVVGHGGTLDSFIGDGIMAIFGAPKERPDAEHAWAATLTAIEMREKCRELASTLRGSGIPADLDVRVGLNTGHCTVGVFGSEVMRAYKAVGFAVNVAARLQSAADPGSVLCGFRTYALIKDRVKAEAREPLVVKGASRPVEAWEIIDLVAL